MQFDDARSILWLRTEPKTMRREKTPLGVATAIPVSYTHLDHRQFCFSSEDLYTRLVAYILDNYGDGTVKNGPNKGQVHGSRFCIMPDDNNIVCQCEKCRQAGNTAQSATSAVVKLMQKVAERFPNHRFFTTSYLTTKNPPSMRMPENTGVLISAIDFPLSYGFESTSQAADFAAKIKKWRAVTPNIYVWDYMRNFDDYLTPVSYTHLDVYKRQRPNPLRGCSNRQIRNVTN